MLVAGSQGFMEVSSALIYSFSLCGLFGTSALYHRLQWNPYQRAWMRRLDHSAIFILIAGTGTPLCLLAIPEKGGMTLLTIVWSAAALGIIQSLFWVNAPKWLAAILYIAMGWVAVPYVSEINEALGSVNVGFLIAGGVVYTIGALVYAFKKPNPWPKTFGYHEIFHLLVVFAALLHFFIIYSLLLGNR